MARNFTLSMSRPCFVSYLVTRDVLFSLLCVSCVFVCACPLCCTHPSRSWQTAPFMEVEVAIRLLYMLGEALPASQGAHFSGDSTKASALQDMMRTVGIFIGDTFCTVLRLPCLQNCIFCRPLGESSGQMTVGCNLA